MSISASVAYTVQSHGTETSGYVHRDIAVNGSSIQKSQLSIQRMCRMSKDSFTDVRSSQSAPHFSRRLSFVLAASQP